VVAKPAYVPKSGDIVWLEFDPGAGHEQGGISPALVLSPAKYNAKTGLMLCCPITNQIKGYPFEVQLEGSPSLAGAILSDQIKSMDWQARKVKYQGTISAGQMQEVKGKVKAVLEIA
jgi:mRNA interferase MazF